MAGLTAASALHEHGVRVVVLDKGRGVGGRMATRRFGDGVFDHGAQFFTVRDSAFDGMVQGWLSAGVASTWTTGFLDAAGEHKVNNYPRYRGAAGMTSIPKHMASGLDVRTGVRVVALEVRDECWSARLESGGTIEADAVILTPPTPQSLALLDVGDYSLPSEPRRILEGLKYDRCLAIMALLDGPSGIGDPGGVQLRGEPVDFLADNGRKGISPAPALTIHSGPEFALTHWDSPDDEAARLLLEAAGEWVGAGVLQTQVHRWRFSKPQEVYEELCLSVEGENPLLFAGDAFGGPKVEGAALSGRAAAERLLGS